MMFRIFALIACMIFPAAAFGQASGPSHGPLSWMQYDLHSGMSYFYGMAVADFDQDGQQEIAFADSFAVSRDMHRSRDALIYLNSNSGGSEMIYREDFSFHPNPNPNPHMLVERMIPVDINGDGWLDIVAVVNSHDAVIAYINPALSGGAWTREVLTISTPGAVNLTSGDPDGDGDSDILVTMRGQSSVYPAAKPGLGWLRNDGSGVWVYSDIEVNAGYSELRSVQAYDIYDQGKDAVVVTDMVTGQTLVYRYNSINGVWAKVSVYGLDATSVYALAYDITGDGVEEYIFARGDGIYYADLAYNVLNPPVTKITGFHSTSNAIVTEIVAGDITGDGVPDLVYTLRDTGVYYSTRTAGVWSTHWVTWLPENYHGVCLLDYDGDGDLDVAVNIEYQRNTLQLWQNKGY